MKKICKYLKERRYKMSEKENNEIKENEEVKQENQEQNEIQTIKQELDDVTDRYKRILAEFENHKKRSQKERDNLYNSILSDIVEGMLPILDNLENAVKAEELHAAFINKNSPTLAHDIQDFIKGYRPTPNGFELKKGVFYKFCQEARSDQGDQEYFFIIDEVNRGNISRIFGEAFMLLEKDKRDVESVKLMYSGEEFSIPGNVYVIGTMNTADRSLAMIDYALRRRFAFFTLKPGFETPGFKAYQQSINDSKFDALIKCIIELNEELAKDETLGEDFCIGHSFFCGLEDPKDPKNSQLHDRLNAIVEYELIPLLQEYWFDQKDKADEWSNRLKDALR